ncbi:dihydroxyacetone kinase subunit DhaK [Haloferax volcanii]|uniref:Phosphoenolpyruvate--dihydroxyacetone phosphotransferase subunit DhaK n=3 Tax=Haloferax volcanii TaxID=2246 RepID=D4GYJ0_HALVD|nr:dihydroxyacetone kinase subunit DhaK [Haloferax volcanii]ADE04633.1 phosphoenolpyruvate--dihydroxyacetone phosphotransferase subunit DhaK [Haloferax volcanii DS2]ELY35771.1 dihydroxyacetone kinase subunit DhaK [Haloferax volcanii DS2]MBS8119344.1 dihydroxyacetone kinase subunit DhaK [Haloferax volcanii]MBS8124357.1 dihydroxyacetone kinase subunit DhaK [Haloferax volcanii]MBS8128226.1 dihydroxyacetone kinase subunit DhaK [Haloferax volcanii]
MKKLINEPGAVVDEMLDGMVAAHPELRRLDGTNVLVRDDAPAEGKVAVVSGGGSGHEPTHAGYLGEGMLDGAAAGEVFTSPTADQLNEMIQATDAGEGVLCVVKNYEGDVMNFDTAAEMAGMEGVDVEQVVVNDDVAVEDSLYTSGRRGVAGTIFVHKCAGAKAAAGGDLDEVTAVAEKVVDNVRTMGMALTSCVTPEKGEPTFDLGEDEIELGIGIHGEPGTERADVMSADEITEHLTENVLDDLDLGEGEEVVTMVNGMGGTPLSELYIVNRKLQSILDDRGVETWDAWVGDYMTSLDMMGCSVSVLRVDDELKELLGAPAETPGLTVTE